MRYLACIIFLLCSLPLKAENKTSRMLNTLDRKINERYIYKVEKDRKINSLKFNLSNSIDLNRNARLSHNLFEEYKSYQYDSAYLYATYVREYALAQGDPDGIAQSYSDLLYCYSTAGFFKEGAEVIAQFPDEGVSAPILSSFYRECVRYYFNLMRFVSSTEELLMNYKTEMLRYTDLALGVLPVSSFDYRFVDVQSDILLNNECEECILKIEELLMTPNLSLSNKAILYSWLGMAYAAREDLSQAIYYTAGSAIADIESCTYETTSAKVLAEYMYQSGNIDRAGRYINMALSDANTYNSPYRKLEIQAIMPEIVDERLYLLQKDKHFLTIISLLIAALLIAIVYSLSNIHRRNIALRAARAELEERAIELSKANEELSTKGKELSQANAIKDKYIIESLYSDSAFVENVEKISKVLVRKIKAKQYTELQDLIGSISIKGERQRMSTTFDKAFLKLFPTFVEEYNKLFAAEHATALGEDGSLSPEMRIFALIRLGIEDVNLISRYLNLSLNTVYVYKAKAKSRTIVPKEEFETYIKAINQPY